MRSQTLWFQIKSKIQNKKDVLLCNTWYNIYKTIKPRFEYDLGGYFGKFKPVQNLNALKNINISDHTEKKLADKFIKISNKDKNYK